MRLCFLHGLESSPRGTKARLLKRHFPNCLVPDLPPDIHTRLEIVEKSIKEPVLITGSSWGGLTAIMYAMARPKMVRGMVLLAPAVGSRDERFFADRGIDFLDSLSIPGDIPTAIIAGLRDDLIPISAVRALVQRSPQPERIRLHEVDDDHSLHRHLDLMLEVIERISSSESGSE